MLIPVTIDLRDLDPTTGPVPYGAKITFARLSPTEVDGTLVTTRPVAVPLTNGHGATQLRAATGYLVGCTSIPGFNWFAVMTGTTGTTLGDLWRTGQIDPAGFGALPVPQSVEQALAAQAAAAAATYGTKADLVGAGAGVQYDQATPSAQWSIPHPLNRRPNVSLYDPAGTLMLADIAATASAVIVTFANPTAGSAVLT